MKKLIFFNLKEINFKEKGYSIKNCLLKFFFRYPIFLQGFCLKNKTKFIKINYNLTNKIYKYNFFGFYEPERINIISLE